MLNKLKYAHIGLTQIMPAQEIIDAYQQDGADIVTLFDKINDANFVVRISLHLAYSHSMLINMDKEHR